LTFVLKPTAAPLLCLPFTPGLEYFTKVRESWGREWAWEDRQQIERCTSTASERIMHAVSRPHVVCPSAHALNKLHLTPLPAVPVPHNPQVEDRPVVKERVEMIKEHRPVSESWAAACVGCLLAWFTAQARTGPGGKGTAPMQTLCTDLTTTAHACPALPRPAPPLLPLPRRLRRSLWWRRARRAWCASCPAGGWNTWAPR